jgi:hypothetical protein
VNYELGRKQQLSILMHFHMISLEGLGKVTKTLSYGTRSQG